MSEHPPVLSRPVAVESLAATGIEFTVETNEGERAALAAADGLVGISKLRGQFLIKPEPLGVVRVTGEVQATITQTCTVTLDAFESEMTEPVDVSFMPERGIAEWLKQHQPTGKGEDVEDVDPPDPIVGGRIDLGAVTAEFLALGLDPYPRKPGVEFEAGQDPSDKDPSPFAALAALKDKT